MPIRVRVRVRVGVGVRVRVRMTCSAFNATLLCVSMRFFSFSVLSNAD